MSDYVDVETAIAEQDFEEARALLRTYLEIDAESAHVWYLASLAAVNEKQRRYFLEKAVELDPLHARAGNALYDLLNPIFIGSVAEANAVHLAPLGHRVVAFLIDVGILMIVSILALVIVSLMVTIISGNALTPTVAFFARYLWAISMMLFSGTYYGYSLTRRQGQTPGKQWMGMRVIRADGKPLTIGHALLRSWVGYTLALSPLGLGFLWAFIDVRQRAWHDIIAGTLVVRA